MAIRIQQDVLRLQIPVNDVQPVQVLYGQEDLTGVEPAQIVGKTAQIPSKNIQKQ